ncbi:MAG: peptidoglycan DD-metalloendopeptidase family protein [Oscillospiraceae bacterium]|jgi:murein DD-endopeptidase MepM/ murein hydrolase activator NlpD|nr:peptidoglycan DD-metalloendopeptidase family protein [Oscillospiraceae bacterium]
MAGKKRPSAAPQPQDDSVYRVKHISRSAWEDGALSLPGLTPRGARGDEPEFDDVAMDMAMTGEIPLELIRDMLRAQEEQAQQRKRRKEPGAGSMIRPEEIVPARAGAEAAGESPTPEEIAQAKAELRDMKARSSLPQPAQEEEGPPREALPEEGAKKSRGRKKERGKKVSDYELAQLIDSSLSMRPATPPAEEAAAEAPAEEPPPARPPEEPRPGSAGEAREAPDGPPSLVRTFGLLPHMRQGRPGLWDDGAPLYRITAGAVPRAVYRSLYYYGLRFVRPLRIAAAYALPHLAGPLLTLWHLLRAVALTLHHITLGRMRRAFQKCGEIHAKRLAARKGRVRLRTMARGVLMDYRLVLRSAANAAMPIAALLALLLVVQGVSGATYALKIDYYGNDLGYVKDESVFLEAKAAANRHMTPQPEASQEGEPGQAEAEPDKAYAQFNIALVRPEQLTSVDILTDQLLDNAPLAMTSACGIFIDGALFATIKNSTDADSVLTSIKNTKAAHLQVGGNAAVGFVQPVELVQGFYPADQLVDAQTLLKMLSEPQREATPVTLGGDATIGGLLSRYGMSLAELYALNPALQGKDSGTELKEGGVYTVMAEVSTLEVKIVQTETRLEDVRYETVETYNSSLYKGEVRTRVKGENGQDRVTERVTYINGKRVGAPEEIGRTRIKEPVTERKELGSKSTTVQRGGQTIVINPSATGFTWPVPGCTRVSSSYGYRGRSFHKGIDIADGNTNGKIIVAAKDGVVELVQLGGTSYGNMILINHGNGVKTRYAHIMSGSISVRQGESVSIGQPIARVGSTGNSTGPHLHFEVLINGSTQNPLNYLKR